MPPAVHDTARAASIGHHRNTRAVACSLARLRASGPWRMVSGPCFHDAMAGAKRWFMRTGNRFGVWMYRKLDGRLSSGSKTVTVLVVTTPGRRTGVPRSTCVRYLQVDDGLLVWGTGSGSRTEPDWFQNLRRVDEADIQVRADHRRVKVRLLDGAERDEVWKNLILSEAPEVEKYERRAGRTIPGAKLEPVS